MLTQAQTTASVAGHFGEWMQGRHGSDGPVVLVTLPCPLLFVRAVWVQAGELEVDWSGSPLIASSQAARLVGELGLPNGKVSLESNMAPARGTGASTAALVALAQAAGASDPEAIARACIAVEGASDPLMLPHPDRVLWAPRRGQVLRELPSPPAFDVIGGFFGDDQVTDPADDKFPDITDLIPIWESAAARGDRSALADCAMASAQRTTALRGPANDPTQDLCQALGALGWVRAHTGSARALVFAPNTVPVGAEERLRASGLRDVLRFRTGVAA
ncbi:MAG: propanediol utilization protein [Pseudomonadota bacterium]